MKNVAREDSGFGPESSVDDVDEDHISHCYPENLRIKDRIPLKSFGCIHSDNDSGAFSGASTPENLNIPPIEHLSSPPLVLTAHRQVHGYGYASEHNIHKVNSHILLSCLQ